MVVVIHVCIIPTLVCSLQGTKTCIYCMSVVLVWLQINYIILLFSALLAILHVYIGES